MAKKMWSFSTKNLVVEWWISPDVFYSKGMEPDLIAECKANLRKGKWKCFQSEVLVKLKGSREVLASAYLGGSIYENPKEFRDHFGSKSKGFGSYFSQMVREAVAEARVALPLAKEKANKQLKALKKIADMRVRDVSHKDNS